jgi:SpoVK/Ycf46/Vps4 family AAA+-type ATPase
MSVDPSVLAAIQLAVESHPDDLALRIHFADLLLKSNDAERCLEQVSYIFSREPDHVSALALGVTAAKAKGDAILAHRYQRILDALQMNQAKNLIETIEFATSFSTDRIETEPLRERAGPIYSEEENEQTEQRVDFERPEITLADVKGLSEVKERINLSFLGPLRNPELRKLYGKSLRGGLLLYGPPGCGKTFVARAIAGELGAKFFNIGLTDVMDMWLGNSEKNLHELFQNARRLQPSVLFFDELDALGRKRSLMRDHSGTTVTNQFLNELDGAQHNNEGVFVIGATNHPWDIDSALRRPGRFDRTLLVLPPDLEARAEILRANLEERPTKNIDVQSLAKDSQDFSCADVAYLVEAASEYALSDSIRTGTVRPIDQNDFKQALRGVKGSVRSWFETAKNHAVFANEGGVYDDLIIYLKQKKIL